MRAQVLIYPALDLRGRLPSRKDLADQFLLPQDMIQWFFGHYFGRRLADCRSARHALAL